MKVLVTGATGFIGRHVVLRLLERGHSVIAVARRAEVANSLDWPDTVTFVQCDLHDPDLNIDLFEGADAIVHLAWPGLPNYDAPYHFEKTLPADYRFLKKLIDANHKHLLISGTCFEYGMRDGCLTEAMYPRPENAYALAKDSLHKYLDELKKTSPFVLQWARLFYTYGAGQNSKSLLAQLDGAIRSGEEIFNMSPGEQLRDYLPVEKVAELLVMLLENPECDGAVNVCSGAPISIRSLVEDYIFNRKANIRPCFGYYPYSKYEPMAFWGDNQKLKMLAEEYE